MSEQDDLEAYNAELAMQHDHETREKNELPNLWIEDCRDDCFDSTLPSVDDDGFLVHEQKPDDSIPTSLYIPAARIRELIERERAEGHFTVGIDALESLISTEKQGKRTDWKQEHDAAVRYHEGCRRMIHEALGEPSYGDCDIWEAMRRKIMELQKNTDPINTLK